MLKEITDANFENDVLKAEGPVLVDFWAPWCGPCKMIAPVIEELSQDMEGKAKFFKINVDENPDIASKYRISSIPNIMVFKNGEVVENMVGFRPKQEFENVIVKHI